MYGSYRDILLQFYKEIGAMGTGGDFANHNIWNQNLMRIIGLSWDLDFGASSSQKPLIRSGFGDLHLNLFGGFGICPCLWK